MAKKQVDLVVVRSVGGEAAKVVSEDFAMLQRTGLGRYFEMQI